MRKVHRGKRRSRPGRMSVDKGEPEGNGLSLKMSAGVGLKNGWERKRE